MKKPELTLYRALLGEIKARVRQAQHRAALSANAEMNMMYRDIGRMIAARQKQEGRGAGVIPRLAADLKNDLPEQKGFSERNIGRMIAFYREYPILPQPAAKLVPPPAVLCRRARCGGEDAGPGAGTSWSPSRKGLRTPQSQTAPLCRDKDSECTLAELAEPFWTGSSWTRQAG